MKLLVVLAALTIAAEVASGVLLSDIFKGRIGLEVDCSRDLSDNCWAMSCQIEEVAEVICPKRCESCGETTIDVDEEYECKGTNGKFRSFPVVDSYAKCAKACSAAVDVCVSFDWFESQAFCQLNNVQPGMLRCQKRSTIF